MMAARNHPQATGLRRHRIQVERELQKPVLRARKPVRVPARIAHVEVPVARLVVVVVPQQRRSHPIDPRVVNQRAQVFALVDKWHEGRPLLAVVLPSPVTAPTFGPDPLELLAYRSGLGRKRPGKAQIAKRLEKPHLLFRKLHPTDLPRLPSATVSVGVPATDRCRGARGAGSHLPRQLGELLSAGRRAA